RERLARDGQALAERTADALTIMSSGMSSGTSAGRAVPAPGSVGRASSLLAAIVDDSAVAQAAHGLRRVVFAERAPALSLPCARETRASIEQAIRAIATTRASLEDQLEPARVRSWSAFLERAASTPSAARFIAPIQ